MNPLTRPPSRPDGSAAIAEESEGDPERVRAAGASGSDNSNSSGGSSSSSGSSGSSSSTTTRGGGGGAGGEGGGEAESQARCRGRSSVDDLRVFRKRSTFTFPRRSSSGYFSFDGDSLPGSPPVTVDRATQTPSPSGQVMRHALQRMAEEYGGGGGGGGGGGEGGPRIPQLSGSPPGLYSTQQQNAAADMREEAVGQELRRIGDDFNRLLLRRRMAARHRRAAINPHHQDPTMLLCLGLLILVMGRLIYMHSGENVQDHSQV